MKLFFLSLILLIFYSFSTLLGDSVRFKLTQQSLKTLKTEGLSETVISQLETVKNLEFTNKEQFLKLLELTIGVEQTEKHGSLILKNSLASSGDSKRFLDKDGKYKNNSEHIVYLVLELPPGESFQNKTGHRFRIYRQEEFSQIDPGFQAQQKVESLEAKLNSLDSKAEVLENLRENAEGEGGNQ